MLFFLKSFQISVSAPLFYVTFFLGGLSYIKQTYVYKSKGNHICGKHNNKCFAVNDVMKYGLHCFVMM